MLIHVTIDLLEIRRNTAKIANLTKNYYELSRVIWSRVSRIEPSASFSGQALVQQPPAVLWPRKPVGVSMPISRKTLKRKFKALAGEPGKDQVQGLRRSATSFLTIINDTSVTLTSSFQILVGIFCLGSFG